MPRYIVVFGRHRMYADHCVQNTLAAMIQEHIRLVFHFGRQMDRSFDLLRHRNRTYTLTMLTDEGLPGGLILRPLAGGELWYNFNIGFNLVSDDYGRQDMGLGGVNENNNDVDDSANSANENNNEDGNNHDEHNNDNNGGNEEDDGENENEENSNPDGGTNGDGVIDLTYSTNEDERGVNENNDDDASNENNNEDDENDDNNHDEHENENNDKEDDDDDDDDEDDETYHPSSTDDNSSSSGMDGSEWGRFWGEW
jgi:hypothetical protein